MAPTPSAGRSSPASASDISNQSDPRRGAVSLRHLDVEAQLALEHRGARQRGHAAIAGACVTVLKAFFDADALSPEMRAAIAQSATPSTTSALTTKMPPRVTSSMAKRKDHPSSPPMVPESRVRIRLRPHSTFSGLVWATKVRT